MKGPVPWNQCMEYFQFQKGNKWFKSDQGSWRGPPGFPPWPLLVGGILCVRKAGAGRSTSRQEQGQPWTFRWLLPGSPGISPLLSGLLVHHCVHHCHVRPAAVGAGTKVAHKTEVPLSQGSVHAFVHTITPLPSPKALPHHHSPPLICLLAWSWRLGNFRTCFATARLINLNKESTQWMHSSRKNRI